MKPMTDAEMEAALSAPSNKPLSDAEMEGLLNAPSTPAQPSLLTPKDTDRASYMRQFPKDEASQKQAQNEYETAERKGSADWHKNVVGGSVKGASNVGRTLLTGEKFLSYPQRKLYAMATGDKEFGVDQILNEDTAARNRMDEDLTSLIGTNPNSGGYKTGKILTEMAGTAAVPIPFASGAKGFFPRIGQGLQNTAVGTVAGGGQGFVSEGQEGVLPGAMFGGATAGGLEVLKGVGAAARNIAEPHLPKLDLAKYLPYGNEIRPYLPSTLQGQTTGAERVAAKVMTDPKIDNQAKIAQLLMNAKTGETAAQAALPAANAEVSGLEKIASANKPSIAEAVRARQAGIEESMLKRLSGGDTQTAALQAEKMNRGVLNDVTTPMRETELTIANMGFPSLKVSKIIDSIDNTISTPGLRINNDIKSVLNGVKEKFNEAIKLGKGVPDARDIYEIRKSGVNEIVDKLMAGRDPTTSKKLSAKLTAEVKPYIDKAITDATGGGPEWANYLQTHSAGEHLISQENMGAKALDLYRNSPEQLIKLGEGNAPKIVEDVFGQGKIDLAEQMGGKEKAIKYIADQLAKRKEVDRLGNLGAGKAGSILRDDEALTKLPAFVDAKVAITNKILSTLQGKGSSKTTDALSELMLTNPRRLGELMTKAKPTEKQLLLNAITQRAAVITPAAIASQK